MKKTDAAFDNNQHNLAEYMFICFDGYMYVHPESFDHKGKLSGANRDEYQRDLGYRMRAKAFQERVIHPDVYSRCSFH